MTRLVGDPVWHSLRKVINVDAPNSKQIYALLAVLFAGRSRGAIQLELSRLFRKSILHIAQCLPRYKVCHALSAYNILQLSDYFVFMLSREKSIGLAREFKMCLPLRIFGGDRAFQTIFRTSKLKKSQIYGQH